MSRLGTPEPPARTNQQEESRMATEGIVDASTGPEESELAAIADLDTFAILPWDERVARVFCDCYDTETGELLDADPRQNLKRIAHDFEQELGYQFLIGIEPETMWLKKPEDGQMPEGLTKPYCYHI